MKNKNKRKKWRVGKAIPSMCLGPADLCTLDISLDILKQAFIL